MRPQRISKGFVITTAAAAAALMLTACGPSGPQTQGTTEPGTTSASPSTSPAVPSTSQAPSSSPTADPSAPSSAPALCKAASLSPATDATGGGAAGSVYIKLILTNTNTAPCLLKGFPGVSLAADAQGAPIGAAAIRDESTPAADVLLAPGQGGAAVLRYTQAGNYMDCTLVSAAGYRIYPPEDTASLFLAQPTQACSNAGIELLTIGAFQPM